MLSAALLRFPHGERSGKTEPPGWALSCGPLPGSVLQPHPPPLAAATAAQASPLASPSLWAFPSLAVGLWVHPPIPAGSVPAAGCWQGLGRRPARSALPGHSGTTLASPQGPSSCVPLALPPSSLAPQRLCRPKYCPLHGQGHPLPSPEPSVESRPAGTGATPDLISCPANALPPFTGTTYLVLLYS